MSWILKLSHSYFKFVTEQRQPIMKTKKFVRSMQQAERIGLYLKKSNSFPRNDTQFFINKSTTNNTSRCYCLWHDRTDEGYFASVLGCTNQQNECQFDGDTTLVSVARCPESDIILPFQRSLFQAIAEPTVRAAVSFSSTAL